MVRHTESDGTESTHSHRSLLKLSGAVATGLAAGPSVVSADEPSVDWEGYRDALADRFNPTEADVAVDVIQRYTDGTKPVSRAEIVAIEEELIRLSDTPQIGADIEAFRENRTDVDVATPSTSPTGTAGDALKTVSDSLVQLGVTDGETHDYTRLEQGCEIPSSGTVTSMPATAATKH